MSDALVSLLPRQMGLVRTVDAVANDIANASTPGYKGEASVFAEHVARAGGAPSISMGHLAAQATDFSAGGLERTDGAFDVAISGEGFFKVIGPDGERLTRAGRFTLDPQGTVVDFSGRALADGGGGAIELPPDAVDVAIARDGTISVDGEVFADIGVWRPVGEPQRAGANHWVAGADEPVEEPVLMQGFYERSNVDPVGAFAELIATQRHFEAGQTLTQDEHDRLTALIEAIRQRG